MCIGLQLRYDLLHDGALELHAHYLKFDVGPGRQKGHHDVDLPQLLACKMSLRLLTVEQK